MTAAFENFTNLDIRAGTVVRCERFVEAKKPAYKLWVDFGETLGVRKSSAQITEGYAPDDLPGTQVLAVVNFAPRQIASFISEVLVLGVYTKNGVVLVKPDCAVENGSKLG